MSLYARLFKYRGRENRLPLEDFLTEALADLLNRMPSDIGRETLAVLVGASDAVRTRIIPLWEDTADVDWATQVAIQVPVRGIIDLVLRINGEPVLVVESKVGSGLRSHTVAEADVDERNQDQLASYGQWLKAQRGTSDWGGALVMLAHGGIPPRSFIANEAIYGVEFTRYCGWSELASFFKRLLGRHVGSDEPWLVFVDEFVAFLEEENMSEEVMTLGDVAAIYSFLPSVDRVRETINRMWNASNDIWKPVTQQRWNPAEYNSEYGYAGMFRYLSPPGLRDAYLMCGFRFPTVTPYRVAAKGDGHPQVFVEFGNEREVHVALKLPENWIEVPEESVWIATRPLASLPSEPEALVAEAMAWTRSRMEELVAAIGKLK